MSKRATVIHAQPVSNWPATLKKAGGWAFLTAILASIGMLFFFPNTNFSGTIIFSSVSLFLLGILVFLAGFIWELLKKTVHSIPPLLNTKFWLKRAVVDVVLVQTWAGILSIPILFLLIGPIGDLLQPSSLFDISYIPTNALPLLIACTQIGMLIIVFWRQHTKAVPKNAISFQSSGWRSDVLAVFEYGFLVIGGSALIDIALSKSGIHLPPQFALSAGSVATSSITGIFLFGAVGAPFFEELFFRGYLLSILRGKGEFFSLIISSLLFGLMHLQPAYFFQLTFVGFILGLSYLRTKNLLVPMSIHAINNFLGIYLLLKS